MSWDVILLDLPPEVTSISELEDDFGSELGPVAAVRGTLVRLFPQIDFTDPEWGILEAEDYSIEFSVDADDPCTSIMLHVRGTENALEPIRRVCAETGWKAFDCSDGELMDWDGDPGRGLREWRAYRTQTMPDAPERGVALPMEGGKRVFFDAMPVAQAKLRKPWWKFWA